MPGLPKADPTTRLFVKGGVGGWVGGGVWGVSSPPPLPVVLRF